MHIFIKPYKRRFYQFHYVDFSQCVTIAMHTLRVVHIQHTCLALLVSVNDLQEMEVKTYKDPSLKPKRGREED